MHGKGKIIVLICSIKVSGGKIGLDVLILNHSMAVSGQYHNLAALSPWERAPVSHLNSSLGGHWNWYGCFGEEKISSPLRILNYDILIIQSVAKHCTEFAVPAHVQEIRRKSSILNLKSEEAWSLGETLVIDGRIIFQWKYGPRVWTGFVCVTVVIHPQIPE